MKGVELNNLHYNFYNLLPKASTIDVYHGNTIESKSQTLDLYGLKSDTNLITIPDYTAFSSSFQFNDSNNYVGIKACYLSNKGDHPVCFFMKGQSFNKSLLSKAFKGTVDYNGNDLSLNPSIIELKGVHLNNLEYSSYNLVPKGSTINVYNEYNPIPTSKSETLDLYSIKSDTNEITIPNYTAFSSSSQFNDSINYVGIKACYLSNIGDHPVCFFMKGQSFNKSLLSKAFKGTVDYNGNDLSLHSDTIKLHNISLNDLEYSSYNLLLKGSTINIYNEYGLASKSQTLYTNGLHSLMDSYTIPNYNASENSTGTFKGMNYVGVKACYSSKIGNNNKCFFMKGPLITKLEFKGYIEPIDYLNLNGMNYDYAMTSFSKGTLKGIPNEMIALYNIKAYLPQFDIYNLDPS